jgi:hypothetical protein
VNELTSRRARCARHFATSPAIPATPTDAFICTSYIQVALGKKLRVCYETDDTGAVSEETRIASIERKLEALERVRAVMVV